jgi:hypothetical protein
MRMKAKEIRISRILNLLCAPYPYGPQADAVGPSQRAERRTPA